jgi:uncharacterized protein YcgI (DUF1989 family)
VDGKATLTDTQSLRADRDLICALTSCVHSRRQFFGGRAGGEEAQHRSCERFDACRHGALVDREAWMVVWERVLVAGAEEEEAAGRDA